VIAPGYMTKSGLSRVQGDMFKLNMAVRNQVNITFTLLQGDQIADPAKFSNVLLSILDLDAGYGTTHQWLITPGITNWTHGSGVNMTTTAAGVQKFIATRQGNAADNPLSAMSLSPEALSSAVALLYTSTSQWTVTLGIDGGDPEGRFFFFAGSTALQNAFCPPVQYSDPTTTTPPIIVIPTPAPTPVPQIFPDTSNEKAMVFVVDESGSMGSIMAYLKDEFKKTVQNLEEWQYFSIVKFSNAATAWKDHLVSVNATNIDEATAWIDTMHASGGTKYEAGLQAAYAMTLPAGSTQSVDLTAVFLLSDGAPGDCPSKESCYQQIFDSKPGVRVRSIALNAGGTVKDILKAISNRTGGDYVDVQVR